MSTTPDMLLPNEMLEDTYAVLERAGVVFGAITADARQIHATLPDGWQKIPTSDPLWSHLVDSNGRARAVIYHRTHRDTFLDAVRRFNIYIDQAVYREQDLLVYFITDQGARIFSAEPTPVGKEAQEAALTQAKAWLAERYPNWEDASTYWD